MSESNSFAEYARSAAFRVDLSPAMITALLNVGTDEAYQYDQRLTLQPYWALRRRGLIEWVVVDDKKQGPRLTDAGIQVFNLLIIAGFGEGAGAISWEAPFQLQRPFNQEATKP